MIRNHLSAGVLASLLVLSIGTAYATMIPGSINSLDNGDFENGGGDLGLWELGSGLALGVDDGIDHNWGVYCKYATQDLALRQVVELNVDNSMPTGTGKIIDLMADIRTSLAPDDPGRPTARIGFRLDWWGTEWNTVSDQSLLPAAEYYSDGLDMEGHPVYRWYDFTENGTWRTVNPFINDSSVLKDATGTIIQPRWVSVEILIEQTPGEVVWVDNVILTTNHLPEPMSLVLGVMGLGSVAGLRRLRLLKRGAF